MYTWEEDLTLSFSSVLPGRMRTELAGDSLFVRPGDCGTRAVPVPMWGGDKGGDLSCRGQHSRNAVARDPASSAMGTVTDSPQDPEGHFQFRVIVLGDAAVGKSSLLRCFAEGPREAPGGAATPRPTVGVEFYSRTVPMPPTGKAKLQLWDTAGQERFR